MDSSKKAHKSGKGKNMDFKRIDITEAAADYVRQIKDMHGEVIFHQSGGCCDGSQPMLLPRDEFYLDDNDVYLGKVAGVDCYIHREQFEYWKHTFLTIDVTKGRGASFSLEIPLGIRFIVRSRLLTDEENKALNH